MASQNILTSEQLFDHPFSLSSETIAYLDKQLTKPRLRILKALEEHGSLQQKELSNAINVSTTSLSNLLSKLEQIKPRLINVVITGRTRTYSLTEEAKAYLKENSAANIRPFTDVSSPEYLFTQAKSLLDEFRKSSSSDWKTSFNKLLSEDVSYAPSNQLVSIYNDFMSKLISLALDCQTGIIDKIYNYIGDIILIDGIKEKVSATLKKPLYRLMPIFQLEKRDPKQAQELMDEIIADLYPHVMKTSPQYTRKISDDKYYAIFYTVVLLRNDFLNCGTKSEALKLWNSSYPGEDSCILSYLANMFDLISQIPKQKNL